SAELWKSRSFIFADSTSTEIFTLSLHDALPICEDFRLVVSQRSLVARQRNIKRFVYNKVVGWFYNSSDGVVAISEGVKEDMVEALSVRRELIHTIYNPAYSEVNVERRREETRHPYFNSESKCTVVLAVVRLVEVKDNGR